MPPLAVVPGCAMPAALRAWNCLEGAGVDGDEMSRRECLYTYIHVCMPRAQSSIHAPRTALLMATVLLYPKASCSPVSLLIATTSPSSTPVGVRVCY